METAVSVFWFRRDLRLHDNAGLFHALQSGLPVLPVFIFDLNILDSLENKADLRVEFIHRTLIGIQQQLLAQHSTLDVRIGDPLSVFGNIMQEYKVKAVYCNHDYEPYAVQRDRHLEQLLKQKGITFNSYKDQVIFEKNEVLKENGQPYTVFTPYSKKWKSRLVQQPPVSFPSEKFGEALLKQQKIPLPSLAHLNFIPTGRTFPPAQWNEDLIRQYQVRRDFPAVEGTSRIGVHLRFGSISIREMVLEAGSISETFLNELIWREFYQMILWHFPHVVAQSFKPAYDAIPWRNDEREFDAWRLGQTGYPIVDAGMRQLNETGYMHNRVRMITASFLSKHLLTDWRLGEAYFAEKLLDFDLASNNGGWQWAAGSGCDAAPYFRIFNPYLQAKKFDPRSDYIRKWVPEYREPAYPRPIVEHEAARKRCLHVYGGALKKK